MQKRFFWLFLILMIMISQSGLIFAEQSSFSDLERHWSKEYVEKLTQKGIIRSTASEFQPEVLITRGEALALLGRTLEVSYGELATPKRVVHVDNKYPLTRDIERLVANLDTSLKTQMRTSMKHSPGEQLLYYLYLSTQNKPMKMQQKYDTSWWISAKMLEQPLSREEASMMLFHLLSERIATAESIEPDDVEAFFAGYYNWKRPSYYIDAKSPFPTAIRSFQIFGSEPQFKPAVKMTRGQFAVVLTRLLDIYQIELQRQYDLDLSKRAGVINLFLTAATQSYQTKNDTTVSRYFDRKAVQAVQKMYPIPLHKYNGELSILTEESQGKTFRVLGQYMDELMGKYQIEYVITLSESVNNSYGFIISDVRYQSK
ncbi:S-layer homology domain-containing protein [Brevibacillus sp. SYSU BS000544]|uniref:S-layer homology domain-containing protein n=1 Tax=Brevibacillus sp. SYSU BS000544 TaxID=3416443 RepID=UPI003CE4C2ED